MINITFFNIITLAPFGLLIGAGATLFFERKLIAIAQKRLGISFTGRQGWAILPADVFKFLTKSISRHQTGTGFGVLGLLGSLLLWSLFVSVFFTPHLTSRLDLLDSGVFSFLLYANLSTILLTSVVLTTRSKFSNLAAVRTALLSPLMELYFVSAINLTLIRTNSLSLDSYLNQPISTLIGLPLIGLALFIFSFFEAKRPPFDHTEAESELVVGHLTEFGGRTLLLFFICEYIHVYTCLFVMTVFAIGSLTPLSSLTTLLYC